MLGSHPLKRLKRLWLEHAVPVGIIVLAGFRGQGLRKRVGALTGHSLLGGVVEAVLAAASYAAEVRSSRAVKELLHGEREDIMAVLHALGDGKSRLEGGRHRVSPSSAGTHRVLGLHSAHLA